MFTFFSNSLLCLRQDDFKITQTDKRKGSKDYIKVRERSSFMTGVGVEEQIVE